jgi:excisionase family DNA binding protein
MIQILTIQQVMEETGISRAKIYQYIDRGELKTLYIGRSRRVHRADLDDFIERLRSGVTR